MPALNPLDSFCSSLTGTHVALRLCACLERHTGDLASGYAGPFRDLRKGDSSATTQKNSS